MLTPGSTVLVSGGAGFIGSHLAHHLVRDGHKVRILDNFATGSLENLRPIIDDVEVIHGDIRSYERVNTAVRGSEVVFHQAALASVPGSVEDPLTSNETNVTGTLNILLAARDENVGRVVFASSSSVYGTDPVLPKQEAMATCPNSPYAVGKQSAESYCRAFFQVFGLETVALRYFNVFGSRQDPLSEYAAVVPKFITALLEGRQPTVFGDGLQTRDFIHIDDTVKANMLAASARDPAGLALNVAGGVSISLNDLLCEMRELTGVDMSARYLDSRPGDIPHSLADISLARQVLGFNPQVDLREGLARTIDYHREIATAQRVDVQA